MLTIPRYRPVFALTLGFSSVLSSALAQDEQDVITVTATKRSAAISDVPVSVSVLAGDAAAAANQTLSAEEITSRLVSVQAAVANGTQIAFQIRGIGAVDHQALTPSGAAVFADGVFLAQNVQTGPMLYDVERIEVLRGPQGALYGRNASSGVISILTAKPGEDQTSYVSASVGRFGLLDLQGAAGTQLAENVHGRIAVRRVWQDAVLESIDTNPSTLPGGPERAFGQRDEAGIRVGLSWTPSDETNVLLRGHYELDQGINAGPVNSALDLDDHQISLSGDGGQQSDNAFYGGSVDVSTKLGDWAFTSITAIEGYDQNYGFDFDGSQGPFGVPSLNANLNYDREFWQASEEVRFSKTSAHGTHLFGGLLSTEDFRQDYLIWCGTLDPETLLGTCRYVGAPGRAGPTPASPGTATTLLSQIEQERFTAALFTHHELDLTERLRLTLAGRLTHESIRAEGQGIHIFDDGTRALNNRDGLGLAVGENEIEETRPTGTVALSYALGEKSRAYGSVATGYKSGGFNGEVQNNATHFSDEGLFGREDVTAYEIGLKSDPTETLRLSVAAFYQDYDAPQARIFVSFPLPDGSNITSNSLANLDRADVFGLEAEMDWRPRPRTEIRAGLSLLDTEIEQTTDVGGNADLFDGNPLPFASKTSLTLGGRQGWTLPKAWTLTASADAKYRSDYFLDAEGLAERRQDGLTTVDASIDLTCPTGQLTISAWGKNLTDEDYAVSGFGFIGYNTFRSAPATYGVRVQKEF